MAIKDKVALVTGASRGIGQAIALELANLGCRVVGTATTSAGADKITSFLEAYPNCKGMVLNIADPGSVEHVLSSMADDMGMPEILINNAGITRDNLFLRMKEEDWLDVLETNLTGVFRLCKACVRPMIKNRWGRIINIGSVVGASGNPGQANYCAAKAGLVGFSKSLAKEIATRGVTVNVVSPGFIETDMTKVLTEQQREDTLKQVPMGRMGQPKDIAAAVAFLASDVAGYITGETLHVNGGMWMS